MRGITPIVPRPADEKLSADEKKEREEATVWIEGLDTINQACGVRFCVDLSATPFYIQGQWSPGRLSLPVACQRFRVGGRN